MNRGLTLRRLILLRLPHRPVLARLPNLPHVRPSQNVLPLAVLLLASTDIVARCQGGETKKGLQRVDRACEYEDEFSVFGKR